LSGANDEQFKIFGLDKMPWEVFTLKHDPEKTDSKYYETLLDKKLTTLSSIDLYAWAGSNIDVEKNTVDLTINVNATYLTE